MNGPQIVAGYTKVFAILGRCNIVIRLGKFYKLVSIIVDATMQTPQGSKFA